MRAHAVGMLSGVTFKRSIVRRPDGRRRVPREAQAVSVAHIEALESRTLLSTVLPETLHVHNVTVDAENKLLSWVDPQDKAYDTVIRLAWDFLKTKVPTESNGYKTYYTYSEFLDAPPYRGDDANNPAGKNAMLTESALLYYAYTGDQAVIDIVKGLLDFQLSSRGTTPANYNWANVPWSSAAGGSLQYGNEGSYEGVGILEPDKIGELGAMYLRFYEFSGDVRYRDAAINCANTLASHVRTGSATQSPWPFRVNAQTGAVAVDYSSHAIAPIELFDELIRLNLGNVASYQPARQTAWNWLMTYPMQTNVWANYFEDVVGGGSRTNHNQYSPDMTARYLLQHPEKDANWQTDVRRLIAWVESNFGQSNGAEPGIYYGARVIGEQDIYTYKMASHTGRYASVNALLYELTGDLTAKDKAFRSLNWATYMAENTGIVIEGPNKHAVNSNLWFTDGYGDYVRHFLVGMGSAPEWAPATENHLLRSSSVVRSVNYLPGEISYTTFENNATEVLRINFTPATITANGVPLAQRTDLAQAGWTFDSALGILRIRHDGANAVRITTGGITTYQLAVSAVNGSVAKTPDQISYASDAQVMLTATPNTGYQFSSWSGDLTGTTNPATITMNGNKAVAASFTAVVGNVAPTANAGPDRTIALPVNSVALSGSATDDGLPNPPGALTTAWSKVSGPGTVTFSNAASSATTATFSSAGAYVLRLAANDSQLSGSDDVAVTVNSVSYTLTTSATNGTISRSPNQSTYVSGTAVILTATPNTGYQFSSWSGDLTGTVNPATITMNANKAVTASFVPVSSGTTQSIWSATEKPIRTTDSETRAVTLGLRFRSSVSGTVTGVRFYKGTQNTGTHTGSLWSRTGALLASVNFSGETASGWQQANFATPVPISANTEYVISYRAPRGRYASDPGYFSSPLVRNSLTAINSVYTYGTSTAFPTSNWQNVNYWVDVVFQPSGILAATAPLAAAGGEVMTAQQPAGTAAQDSILGQLFSTVPIL